MITIEGSYMGDPMYKEFPIEKAEDAAIFYRKLTNRQAYVMGKKVQIVDDVENSINKAVYTAMTNLTFREVTINGETLVEVSGPFESRSIDYAIHNMQHHIIATYMRTRSNSNGEYHVRCAHGTEPGWMKFQPKLSGQTWWEPLYITIAPGPMPENVIYNFAHKLERHTELSIAAKMGWTEWVVRNISVAYTPGEDISAHTYHIVNQVFGHTGPEAVIIFPLYVNGAVALTAHLIRDGKVGKFEYYGARIVESRNSLNSRYVLDQLYPV